MNDWGLKYIQIKADIYETTTAKRIRRKYGVEGLVAYIVLRLEIARNGYYLPWDEDTAADLADGALGISEECYRGVAEICAETGTFYREQYEKYHIITGPEMQENFLQAMKRRKKRLPIVWPYWRLEREGVPTCVEWIEIVSTPEYHTEPKDAPKDTPTDTPTDEPKKKVVIGVGRNGAKDYYLVDQDSPLQEVRPYNPAEWDSDGGFIGKYPNDFWDI